MATLVLTVIGDDQSGLVNALAQVVSEGGGNWEGSHLAELAGKFAGIVVVTVPDAGVEDLVAALRPLDGLLDITVHTGTSGAAGAGHTVAVEIIGNDRPGIVREVSGVLARHGLSIAEMATATREAPMAGGRLFEARLSAPVPADANLEALRADLERIAHEVLVEITVAAT